MSNDTEPARAINGRSEKSKDKKRKHKSEPAESESRLSKEERREKKRLKREKRERKAQEAAEVSSTAKDNTEQDVDDKAARKAAKEARKAAKKQRKENVEQDNDTALPQENGKSTITADGSYQEVPSLTALPQTAIDKYMTSNHITINDAGAMSNLRPIMEFSQLTGADSLPAPFNTFKVPSPIQAASWPFLLSGRDVVGVAETGSGKTLAFGVPCVRHVLARAATGKKHRSSARAVIVSPTRELAVQIHEQLEKLAHAVGLEAVCVYGGVPKDAQRAALRTAQIVVATPGRLNDLIQEGSADLGGVSYVVLDEADRMLDKGFEEEIRKIISSTLPSKGVSESRQTLMFTATWPPSVRELAATFMNQPVRINIGEDNPTGELRANTRIKQLVEVVDPRSKEQRMLQLLKQHQSGKNARDRILVFCLYKKEAQRVENFIRQRGLRVAGIHGDLTQDRRTKSLESFKSGETPLLVATDVAARGLDIPNVKLVLNVTFPLTAEDYVHRIGRTGRAGSDGLAITLFTEQDKAQSGALINVLRAANQTVPEDLLKFGTTVKKKQHDTYGAFYKEDTGKKAEKIKFDD